MTNPQRQTIYDAISGYVGSFTDSANVLSELVMREILQRELRDAYGALVPEHDAFAPRYDAAIGRMHAAVNRVRPVSKRAAQTMAEIVAAGEVALIEARGGYTPSTAPWRMSDAEFAELYARFDKTF